MHTLLLSCDVAEAAFMASQGMAVRSPINGQAIARIAEAGAGDVSAAVGRAHAAFLDWRHVPAPKRGELVRLFGDELRENKEPSSAGWSRSKPARSRRKGSAKCRR